jgi:hypothetical protein
VKHFLIPTLFIAVLAACNSSSQPTESTDNAAVKSDTAKVDHLVQGTYKGDFGGSPIYITINFQSGKHVAGYNTHKGLRRNISGTLEKSGNGWQMIMNEPGDNPFDGQFKLDISEDFRTAKGTWTPTNNPSLKEKSFTLDHVILAIEQINPRTSEEFSYLSGDHVDLNFETDGTCILNYYDKINDSTFAGQMRTVRGTWEKKDSAITVNWQKNENWTKSQSVYNIHYETFDANEGPYMTSVTGDGFELSTPY